MVIFSSLRNRAQVTFGDPVGTFRRHLKVLERTAPTVVPAANRLRPGRSIGGDVIPPFRASGTRSGYRPELGVAKSLTSRPPIVASNVRRDRPAQKRRRDVFFALTAAAIGSLVLSLVPGLRVMRDVQILSDLLLAGYVGLLIRMRNLAAERAAKLTYLPRSGGAVHGHSRRRVPVRSGYDDTGELDLGGYATGTYGEPVYRRIATN